MDKKEFLLEACVDSVESAINARKGGADRLELCSNLVIGGTTPSKYLFEEIKKRVDIPINVLIRPRFGDFCYTDHEFDIMVQEVKLFSNLGANGVVIGILNPDGTLDWSRMKVLIDAAKGIDITLHRAFDMCRDPQTELHQAIVHSVNTILTSGQQNHCKDAGSLLASLVEEADGKIDIMVGSGVEPDNLETLYEATKATSYHMSGKVVIESEMKYRNPNVVMGVATLDEYVIWRTDEKNIRKAKEILANLDSKIKN